MSGTNLRCSHIVVRSRLLAVAATAAVLMSLHAAPAFARPDPGSSIPAARPVALDGSAVRPRQADRQPSRA